MDFHIFPKKGAGELTAVFEYNGQKYHAEKQGDGSYLVRVEGFMPKDLGNTVTLTGECDGAVTPRRFERVNSLHKQPCW